MTPAIRFCEIVARHEIGKVPAGVGVFQVYDVTLTGKKLPTMTRPAAMCQACVDFAKECGMTVEREDDETPDREDNGDRPVDEPSCPMCGGRMWDNRLSKRNPRAPDYKCRSHTCEGVIWPPRISL
jgi:hypothetical protein